jgi:hypothetical protein
MIHEKQATEVRYEETDASASTVILSLVIIAGILVVTMVVGIGIQQFLKVTTPLGQPASPLAPSRTLPPTPKLEVHPWETYPEILTQEEQMLRSYGKDAQGHIHIPIDRAMDLVLPKLPTRPDSPRGQNTPGGNDWNFSGHAKADQFSEGNRHEKQ